MPTSTSALPGTTILNLPIALTLDGSEYVPLVQGGTTKRAQAGIITNTLSNIGFVLATSAPAGFSNSRQLSGQGLVSITDGGPSAPITVSMASTGLSVIGTQSTASSTSVGNIIGTTDQILRVSSAGSSLAFGQINLASSNAVSNVLGTNFGGTGSSNFTPYQLIVAGSISSAPFQSVTAGTSGFLLTYVSSTALPVWQAQGAVAPATLGNIAIYTSTNTIGGATYINGSSAALTLGLASSLTGQLLLASSAGGTTTIQPALGATYNFNLSSGAGTAGQPLLSGGGGAANQTYGTLLVPGGGTGGTSFTAFQVITAGTVSSAPFQTVTAGTSGFVLTYVSSTALPTWQAQGTIAQAVAGNMAIYTSTSAIGGATYINGSSGSLTLGLASSATGKLLLASSGGGTTTIQPSSVSVTLTGPLTTDTLVGKATVDTLTGKTFDTAGSSNHLSINGTAITAITGSSNVVLGSTPTISGAQISSGTITSPQPVGTWTSTGTWTITAPSPVGTWTSTGTWTLGAYTLGGNVSGGANQINNVIIGASQPSSAYFSAVAIGSTIDPGANNIGAFRATIANKTLTTTPPSADSISNSPQLTVLSSDGGRALIGIQGFGTVAPSLIGYGARGVSSAATATQAGDAMFSFFSAGFTGSSYIAAAGFIATALDNFSSVAAGGRLDFYVTPSGTTSLSPKMILTGTGGLAINSTADPGLGMVIANSSQFLIRTKTSWANGAGATTPTITNAPSSSPTKWIPIDDNGTTRFIPAW